jgi:hypothetical protein
MSASAPVRAQIRVVGPECIEVQVGFDGAGQQRHTHVRDVEKVLDQLEAWLWQPKVRSDTYEVAVSVIGLDGGSEETVAPNRYLALYFIATTLARAVPVRPMRSGPSLPNTAEGAE